MKITITLSDEDVAKIGKYHKSLGLKNTRANVKTSVESEVSHFVEYCDDHYDEDGQEAYGRQW